MKGIPAGIEGPKGLWYKRINEAVTSAATCRTQAELEEALGPPDRVEVTAENDRMPAGETRPDPRYPDRYFVYQDPLRPRRTYRYGISDGKIVEMTRSDGLVPSVPHFEE